jgi:hypothetical protein
MKDKTTCECGFDSQICYIKYLNGLKRNNKVYIRDYLNDIESYNIKINNNEITLVCEYGEKLKCIYGSSYKKDYFSHVNNNGTLNLNTMSDGILIGKNNLKDSLKNTLTKDMLMLW